MISSVILQLKYCLYVDPQAHGYKPNFNNKIKIKILHGIIITKCQRTSYNQEDNL